MQLDKEDARDKSELLKLLTCDIMDKDTLFQLNEFLTQEILKYNSNEEKSNSFNKKTSNKKVLSILSQITNIKFSNYDDIFSKFGDELLKALNEIQMTRRKSFQNSQNLSNIQNNLFDFLHEKDLKSFSFKTTDKLESYLKDVSCLVAFNLILCKIVDATQLIRRRALIFTTKLKNKNFTDENFPEIINLKIKQFLNIDYLFEQKNEINNFYNYFHSVDYKLNDCSIDLMEQSPFSMKHLLEDNENKNIICYSPNKDFVMSRKKSNKENTTKSTVAGTHNLNNKNSGNISIYSDYLKSNICYVTPFASLQSLINSNRLNESQMSEMNCIIKEKELDTPCFNKVAGHFNNFNNISMSDNNIRKKNNFNSIENTLKSEFSIKKSDYSIINNNVRQLVNIIFLIFLGKSRPITFYYFKHVQKEINFYPRKKKIKTNDTGK